MKKVNAFLVGVILILLTGGVNAQAQSATDYFAGDWEILLAGTPNGDITFVMHLERMEGKFQGSFKTDMGELKIDKIEEKETSITLYFTLDSYDLDMLLEKVDDNNIKGDMVGQFTVTGKRVVK